MKKNSKIIIIILLIVIIGLLVYVYHKSKKRINPMNNPIVEMRKISGPQLFINSPVYKSSYLISTPTYDANTKLALTGFNVTKKVLADGSTEITLNAQNPEYKTQTYTVKPSEKLYFIETNLKDDGNNEEKYLGDDTAILVDANGYIVVQ